MIESKVVSLLFADDTPDSRFLIQAYLRGLRLVITFAENGLEAVQAYENTEFDLLLMDIDMPGLSGPNALAEIRKWEVVRGLPPVPAISLSGHDEVSGFDHHLKKPVKKAQLLELLMRIFPSISDLAVDLMATSLDDEIRALMPTYLKNREKDLMNLSEALRVGNFDQCASIFHRIRGTAASYGFPSIGKIAERGEQYSNQSDWNSLHLALRSFRSEIARQRAGLSTPAMPLK